MSQNRTNSETHPYMRAENWAYNSDFHFWNSASHSDKAKAYFKKFWESQVKIAERRCKEDAIS